ncbi:hypothetical protein M9H77_25141 [Catharanthus roseus]|uniref:Uncharacterized protein n=1 Tax=Catharanthus roseus TaxID=4058 RepID=A0ACC0AA99_CATRO|nr:hypothetical protein M9H77_25141 [Catharanthus roseus]
MNREGERTPSSGCVSQAALRHHSKRLNNKRSTEADEQRRTVAKAVKKKGRGRGRVIVGYQQPQRRREEYTRREGEKAAQENEERRGIKKGESQRAARAGPASLTQSNCRPTL